MTSPLKIIFCGFFAGADMFFLKVILLSILLTSKLLAGTYGSEYSPELESLNSQHKIKFYLLRAAKEGDYKIVNAIIESKFNLDITDDKGYTPLILAAYHGHKEIVDALIESGANPCQKDGRGNTALMGAIFKGELSIGRKLIAANCVDEKNNAGQTPAMYAALFQRLELLNMLKNSGADLSSKDNFGNTVESLKKGEIKIK